MKNKELISNNTLREKRNALGIRQQDVADLLGFQITDRISHWEKGQAAPSIFNLSRLCKIYKKQPYEIYPDLFEEIQ